LKKVDFIKNEVLKTGFPVEMEILSFLNSRDWFATPNDYYFDFDLNIARDIDIHAAYNPISTRKGTHGFNVSSFLAIECKKSEANAWIFFKTKFKSGRFACVGQYADYLRSQETRRLFDPIFISVMNSLHYYSPETYCTSYTHVKMTKSSKGDKTRNEIFEAVNQVTKYVSYQVGDYLEILKESRGVSVNQCFLFFPVIVFDGELYLASSTNGGVTLEKAKHVVLATFYKPKYEMRRCPFFVDVMTRGYFPKYLSRLEKTINRFSEKIAKIPEVNQKFIDALADLKKD
jgi:hypothetical protein